MTPERTIQQPSSEQLQLFPASLATLDAHLLEMDLYLKPGRRAVPVLYRSIGVEFTAEDRARLIEQGVQFVYIPIRQHGAFRRAMLARLSRVFHDPETSRADRVRAIRSACAKMIEDVLLFPGQAEAVDAVAEVSQQFAEWSREDRGEFSYLLDMSAHDYYTVTHMVNVGVGCGLLSHDLRPGDRALQSALIQGGMLHDVGKRGVPERLLNKEGQLEPHEWEIIRKHPEVGHHELSTHPKVPPTVLEMIRDHHERPDGKVYPRGVAGSDLGLPARVCAVVDVYDAICAARPYRSATPPADALQIMRDGCGTQFDGNILGVWTALVERLIREDPHRATAPSESGPSASLSDLLPRAPVEDAGIDSRPGCTTWGGEHRRHARLPCRMSIRAQLVRQGKRGPVQPGQWVTLQTLDVSRGGIQLQTPWPMSLNDVLRIELPLGPNLQARRLALVVRVRRADQGGWIAGLCFVGDENGSPSRPSARA